MYEWSYWWYILFDGMLFVSYEKWKIPESIDVAKYLRLCCVISMKIQTKMIQENVSFDDKSIKEWAEILFKWHFFLLYVFTTHIFLRLFSSEANSKMSYISNMFGVTFIQFCTTSQAYDLRGYIDYMLKIRSLIAFWRLLGRLF